MDKTVSLCAATFEKGMNLSLLTVMGRIVRLTGLKELDKFIIGKLLVTKFRI